MRNIEKPKRLLEFVTLPQCILAILITLAAIQRNEYPEIGLVIVFSFQGLINMAIILYYMKNKNREKIEPKALYAFLIGFLAICSCGVVMIFDQFSSSSVISPETLYLLCNSVSMIYLSAAIIKQTNQEKKFDVTTIIALCLVLPVVVYRLLDSSYSFGDICLVLALGLFCVFLFLLGKLAYMLYNKRKKPEQTESDTAGYSRKYRIFIMIAAVLLPQVGLMVNNHMFGVEVLGDFTNIWFYIIAAANGMLLLVDINKIHYKMPVFYLKTVGFTFIFYFTLIFIPYMPYAIIGIALYGLGLLVYVPAVIFVAQIKQLYKDSGILKNTYQKHMITIVAIAGFLTLPVILTVNFSIDRANFGKAMAYVNLNHTAQQEVSLSRLNRAISQIEETMVSTRQRESITFLPGTPIVSTVYRYIALNNMFYTEDTVSTLQKLFMPEKVVRISEIMYSEPERNQDFDTKLSVGAAEYDAESGVYKAWVDLEIQHLEDSRVREYRTKFALPDGCFITDYYLYVGTEKKRGIMTDKRAAQVAYESIIRTPKDPGIIYYENDNMLTLRVFPFGNSETRRTGFQVMYSQNETLTIEGQVVDLTAEKPVVEPIHLDGVQFIPADYKKNLPDMERKPLYYFLLDAGDAASYPKHLELAKQYANNRNIRNPIYYAVSYQAKEVTELTAGTQPVIAKGGFHTAFAMKEILSSVPKGYFPIMLLVTDNINRAVPIDKTQLTKTFPESNYYYRLNSDLSLTPYGFSDLVRLQDVKEPFAAKALNYHEIAVRDDGSSETIFSNLDFTEYMGNLYINAFILQKNTFTADTSEAEVSQIKESIRQRVLTKNTAFIVMETKEQEDMLFALQEGFLNGSSVEIPSVMMSEPGWIVMIAMLGMAAFLKYRLNREI